MSYDKLQTMMNLNVLIVVEKTIKSLGSLQCIFLVWHCASGLRSVCCHGEEEARVTCRTLSEVRIY